MLPCTPALSDGPRFAWARCSEVHNAAGGLHGRLEDQGALKAVKAEPTTHTVLDSQVTLRTSIERFNQRFKYAPRFDGMKDNADWQEGDLRRGASRRTDARTMPARVLMPPKRAPESRALIRARGWISLAVW